MDAVPAQGCHRRAPSREPDLGGAGPTSSCAEPALRTQQKAEDSGGATCTRSDLALILACVDSAVALAPGPGWSLLRPVLSALVLHLRKDALVKQQVGTGGQHLLQARLADGVIRGPQPLVASGERVLGRRWGPPVSHEVS